MTLGILDTIGLAAALVLAIPIGLFGAEQLVRGDLLAGVVYISIAVLLVLIEQYLTTPTDIPAAVAEKTVGAVVKTEQSKENE